MARLARVVAPGYPHHLPSPGLRKAGVTQRGNPRQRTFLSQRDYAAYLELMGGSGTVPNGIKISILGVPVDGVCVGADSVRDRV